MRNRIVAGALAMGIAATLAGCFANPLDAVVDSAAQGGAEQAAEELIEGMTGGESAVEFGSLPEGFPADIPLISENIIQSMTVDEGMVVVVSDSRDKDELVAQVESDFADWEQQTRADMGEMVTTVYTNGESMTVNVTVIAASGDDDATVGYTVIPSQ